MLEEHFVVNKYHQLETAYIPLSERTMVDNIFRINIYRVDTANCMNLAHFIRNLLSKVAYT